MTNEERFKLLEDTIRDLRDERDVLQAQMSLMRVDHDDQIRRYQNRIDVLEERIGELNRRLFKDTQMTGSEFEVTESENGALVFTASPPSPAQTLQQLMQAAGVNIPVQNHTGTNGPRPIATAAGPVCPYCHGAMNKYKLSANSTRYACLNAGCGKVIII